MATCDTLSRLASTHLFTIVVVVVVVVVVHKFMVLLFLGRVSVTAEYVDFF